VNELSQLMREIAEQVRGYDVGASALRVARRRRNLRRTAPIVAALLLVALIAGVWLPLHRADAPSTSPLFWLPSRVAAPDASTPYLPTDRAVGLAALVYSPCPQDCWQIVVMRDGTQYQLGSPAGQPAHKLSAGLSPDGRWLAYPDAKGDLALRDLTAQTTVTFPGMKPGGWSPGNRYLALVPVNYRSPAPVTVVDLTTVTAIRTVSMREPQVGNLTEFAAILDTGELLWVAAEMVGRDLLAESYQVQFTDLDGQVLRQWVLQPPASSRYLDPTGAIIPTADGRLIVRFTAMYDWGMAPGPADIVEASTGAVLARYPVPPATSQYDVWIAAGLVGDQLLLAHGQPTQPQVALMYPTNSKPQPVSHIDGGYGAPVLPGNS